MLQGSFVNNRHLLSRCWALFQALFVMKNFGISREEGWLLAKLPGCFTQKSKERLQSSFQGPGVRLVEVFVIAMILEPSNTISQSFRLVFGSWTLNENIKNHLEPIFNLKSQNHNESFAKIVSKLNTRFCFSVIGFQKTVLGLIPVCQDVLQTHWKNALNLRRVEQIELHENTT